MMAQRILVVDDTRVVLEFLEFVFQQAGFDVVCAASGEAALAVAQETRPDVLLVDVLMQGWTDWRCAGNCAPCQRRHASPSCSTPPR